MTSNLYEEMQEPEFMAKYLNSSLKSYMDDSFFNTLEVISQIDLGKRDNRKRISRLYCAMKNFEILSLVKFLDLFELKLSIKKNNHVSVDKKKLTQTLNDILVGDVKGKFSLELDKLSDNLSYENWCKKNKYYDKLGNELQDISIMIKFLVLFELEFHVSVI